MASNLIQKEPDPEPAVSRLSIGVGKYRKEAAWRNEFRPAAACCCTNISLIFTIETMDEVNKRTHKIKSGHTLHQVWHTNLMQSGDECVTSIISEMQ